jgi:hypothetical protein
MATHAYSIGSKENSIYFLNARSVVNVQLKNYLPAVVGHFSITHCDHYRKTQNRRQI